MERFLMFGVIPLLKGVAIAITAAAIGLEFWQSIVIAIVSATLTGIFMLLAANLSRRAQTEQLEHLSDLKKAIGAAKRESDH